MKVQAMALVAAMSSAGLVAPVMADENGRWLDDAITGCQVWSAETVDGESVVWSGDCLDGKANGDGVAVFSDGAGVLIRYRGPMTAGKVDGTGSLAMRNDETGDFDFYRGEFVDGVPDGRGRIEHSEGWTLDGAFDGAFDTGVGVYEGANGDVMRGAFEHWKPKGPLLVHRTDKNGDIYAGDEEDGQRDGLGRLLMADGQIYFGEFAKGKVDGLGAWQMPDGNVYAGRFVGGQPNGFGSWRDANGVFRQGRFVDGKPDGMVLVTDGEGNQDTETWKDGKVMR